MFTKPCKIRIGEIAASAQFDPIKTRFAPVSTTKTDDCRLATTSGEATVGQKL